MKPLDFSCVLRLAKSQLMENGFKDSVIERLYGLLLEYTANESHSIAFPDVTLLAVIQVSFYSCCSDQMTVKAYVQAQIIRNFGAPVRCCVARIRGYLPLQIKVSAITSSVIALSFTYY